MTLQLPGEAKFSIGTTDNTAAAAQSKVDMSLDDIIKSRRTESKSTNQRSTGRRGNIKKPTTSLKEAAKKSAQNQAKGTQRASRQAKTNFRRGMRSSKSATKMEVEKEVRKETKKNPVNRGPGRRTAPRGEVGRRKMTLRPPTKKVIKAAVSAMTSAGFKVPDGMKVVISVEKNEPGSQGKVGNKDVVSNHPNASKGGRLWGRDLKNRNKSNNKK